MLVTGRIVQTASSIFLQEISRVRVSSTVGCFRSFASIPCHKRLILDFSGHSRNGFREAYLSSHVSYQVRGFASRSESSGEGPQKSISSDKNSRGGVSNVKETDPSEARDRKKKLTKQQHEEHEEFVRVSGGAKPDPKRMWKSVPHEEASTDTGGYIKLEDIGIDPTEVDAVHQKDNEKDERLKAAKTPVGSVDAGKKDKDKPQKDQGQKDSKKPGKDELPRRSEKEAARQKDHQKTSEEGQEDSTHRRTVSSAQQSVVWESNPRSTLGSSQSSPEAGGIELLTEQLLDREAAEGRSREPKKEEKDDGQDPKKNGSDSDSDSDDEKTKKAKRKTK